MSMHGQKNIKKSRLLDLSLIQDKGYSTVEMAVGMLLLVLFSAAVFMLALSASDAYKRLNSEKENDASLRIAASYVMTKIRQNDTADGINVIHQEGFPREALKLTTDYGEEVYETWVYISNGKLRETMVLKNAMVDDDLGFDISELDSMALSEDEAGGITVTMTIGDKTRTYYVVRDSDQLAEETP